jgi:hypothetical protein
VKWTGDAVGAIVGEGIAVGVSVDVGVSDGRGAAVGESAVFVALGAGWCARMLIWLPPAGEIA